MKLKLHEMEIDGLIRYAVLRRDQIQDRESKLSFIFLGFANPELFSAYHFQVSTHDTS
jgi:hypothetical protein